MLGEFIGLFGEKGFGIGQFQYLHDVKITPNGRVYVILTGVIIVFRYSILTGLCLSCY